MTSTRYRTAAISAIPIGIGAGVALSLTVYLTGNADFRAQGGWGALAYMLATGAGLGAASALAALVGGWLVIRVAGRRPRGPIRIRSARGAAGAGAGAGALWLTVGVVSAFTAPTGAVWLLGFVVVASVAAVLATTIAWILLRRSERARELDAVSDQATGS